MTTSVDVAPVERVVEAIEGRGLRIKDTPTGYTGQCPAHDDREPSLSINTGDDGRALLRCHAGCAVEDVVEALGLRWADLHPGEGNVEGVAARSAPPAAPSRYEYRRADGTVIGAVVRRSGKRFHQERLIGVHWESGGCDELKFTPYRLPELLAAVAAGRPILCVEGERDVDTAWSHGIPATCNAGGAGKWTPAHAAHLAGAEVTVVSDQDDPGRAHAAAVAASLHNVARSVQVVAPAAGKDWTDHVAAGYGVAQLREVDPRGRRAHVTWASEIEPEPVDWAWEDNGEGRIPSRSLCLAAGREGTGKSTFGAWMTARVTRGELPGSFYGTPRRVLYVAVEDSWKHTIVPRLMAAGADLSMVGRFDVITDKGAEDTLSLPHDNALFEAEINRHAVALVVIDPLMSAIGASIDTHRERDVRTALDPLSRLAERTGIVLVGIAHFNKSSGTDVANLITGSGAFKNVARAVLGFARDDEGRVMTQVKNSVGPDDLPSLGYTIDAVGVPTPKGVARTSKFTFTGPSDRSVSDVLRDARTGDDDEGEQSEQDFTVEWLRNYLIEAGGSAPFRDVVKAARRVDIAERTLKRARTRAGVTSKRSGYQQGAAWSIEDQSGQTAPRLRVVGPDGPNGPDGLNEGAVCAGQTHSGHSGHPVGVRASDAPSAGRGPDGVPHVPLTGGCDVCDAEPAVTFTDCRRCAVHNPMLWSGDDHVV